MINLAGAPELLIYMALMAVGAILAVVIPYVLNKWNDPKTEVDWRYVAVLVFGILLAVFFFAPDKVEEINMSIIKIAILAGYGLQAFINKVVKSIIEEGNAPEDLKGG